MYLSIISLREALVGITNFCGLVYVRVCSEIQQELKYLATLQTVRPLPCSKIIEQTHVNPNRCSIVETLCSIFTIQCNLPRSKTDQDVIQNRICNFSHAVRKDISLCEF
jgi:hypothetical protein